MCNFFHCMKSDMKTSRMGVISSFKNTMLFQLNLLSMAAGQSCDLNFMLKAFSFFLYVQKKNKVRQNDACC